MSMPEYMRGDVAAMQAARLVGEDRLRVRAWLIEQLEAGAEAGSLYDRISMPGEGPAGVRVTMSRASFENNHVRWADLEVQRKRNPKPPPEPAAPAAKAGLQLADVPRAIPRQPGAEMVVGEPPPRPQQQQRPGAVHIAAEHGSFTVQPVAGGRFRIEFTATVDRSTCVSLTGQAFGILVPSEA